MTSPLPPKAQKRLAQSLSALRSWVSRSSFRIAPALAAAGDSGSNLEKSIDQGADAEWFIGAMTLPGSEPLFQR